MGLALLAAAVEVRAQRAQRRRLVLVAPQLLELGGVGLVRRADRLGRQREDLLDEREAPAAGQRAVGDERRRARRAVDERHALLGRQLVRGAEVEEQAPEGEDLARAAVALPGHPGIGRPSSMPAIADPSAPRTPAWPSIRLASRASTMPRTTRSGSGSPKDSAVHSRVGRRARPSAVSAVAAPSPGAVVIP